MTNLTDPKRGATRQVVLDTETTGLDHTKGHRVIEIGCVELVDRVLTGRTFNTYLQPDCLIDPDAQAVHGISNDFLRDKPRFAGLARSFLEFVNGAELIAHNAPFDVGFLNSELARLGEKWGRIQDYCRVTDTVPLARKRHPGKRVTLDHLCTYYKVDRRARTLHGALLDAQLLAQVYLLMTGVQTTLFTEEGSAPDAEKTAGEFEFGAVSPINRRPLKVIRATEEEEVAHRAFMKQIEEVSGRKIAWTCEAPAEDASQAEPEPAAGTQNSRR